MTCALDQMNPRDALYDRAKKYPGGIEALAGRLVTTRQKTMSPSVLYKKLEHNNDTHHLLFDEYVDIVALLASASVPYAFQSLRALNWRFDHVAVHVPSLCSPDEFDLTRDMVKTVVEVGDVARRVDSAMANDGRIDDIECREIEIEIEQAIAALVVLRDRARSMRSENKRRGCS